MHGVTMNSDDVARRLVQKHPLQKIESPSRGFSAFLHVGLQGLHLLLANVGANCFIDPWPGQLLILLPISPRHSKSSV